MYDVERHPDDRRDLMYDVGGYKRGTQMTLIFMIGADCLKCMM